MHRVRLHRQELLGIGDLQRVSVCLDALGWKTGGKRSHWALWSNLGKPPGRLVHHPTEIVQDAADHRVLPLRDSHTLYSHALIRGALTNEIPCVVQLPGYRRWLQRPRWPDPQRAISDVGKGGQEAYTGHTWSRDLLVLLHSLWKLQGPAGSCRLLLWLLVWSDARKLPLNISFNFDFSNELLNGHGKHDPHQEDRLQLS
jgi:hypothetical protein